MIWCWTQKKGGPDGPCPPAVAMAIFWHTKLTNFVFFLRWAIKWLLLGVSSSSFSTETDGRRFFFYLILVKWFPLFIDRNFLSLSSSLFSYLPTIVDVVTSDELQMEFQPGLTHTHTGGRPGNLIYKYSPSFFCQVIFFFFF